MKTAYTLKNNPDLLFLQLDERREDEDSVERLKREVDWIDKISDDGKSAFNGSIT
jgi:hypothetical protein